jgi:osmotically-inducible protein OsmY
MTAVRRVLDEVRRTLRSEPRIDLHRTPVKLSLDSDGVMIVEGEVENVAAKKLALERIAAVSGIVGIVDRLRVRSAQPMGDGQIRDLVRDALLQEPTLTDITLRERVKGELRTVREPAEGTHGEIAVSVADGVVTLDGDVPGFAHKSLAGVLAWWVPGTRDVVNGLGVFPPEEADDGEITEAVRVALDKDPFVDVSQVRVRTRGREVVLMGVVPTEAQREMAEFDAWYVFGVDRVVNRIAVRR